jgi:hypothetical protein
LCGFWAGFPHKLGHSVWFLGPVSLLTEPNLLLLIYRAAHLPNSQKKKIIPTLEDARCFALMIQHACIQCSCECIGWSLPYLDLEFIHVDHGRTLAMWPKTRHACVCVYLPFTGGESCHAYNLGRHHPTTTLVHFILQRTRTKLSTSYDIWIYIHGHQFCCILPTWEIPSDHTQAMQNKNICEYNIMCYPHCHVFL